MLVGPESLLGHRSEGAYEGDREVRARGHRASLHAVDTCASSPTRPHPECAEFLQSRLTIMRLKERIVILLIGACCVLCVLFVIQAKIVDDSAWEFPKKFK